MADNNEVLYPSGAQHVATALLNGRERPTLVVTAHYGEIEKMMKHLGPVELKFLKQSGLEPLVKLAKFQVDKYLISALVERWSGRTNTFHLPVGEMTVTLEDVAFITGVAVDGKPVAGTAMAKSELYALCEKLLGRELKLEKGQLKLAWLKESFQAKAPRDASKELLMQRTRAFLIWLVGCTLIPDASKSFVSPNLLPLFEDICSVGEYAWGSATLAHLYCNLNKATRKTATSIPCNAALLQVWAYSRFALPYSCPYPTTAEVPIVQAFPFKSRAKIPVENGKRTVKMYREFFNMLQENQVYWQPYEKINVVDPLREYVHAWSTAYILGQETIWLVCFSTLEKQLPPRTARQFGFIQTIPVPPPEICHRHLRCYGDRLTQYGNELGENKSVLDNLVGIDGELISDRTTSEDYMDWYKGVSRVVIEEPAVRMSERNLLAEHLTRIISLFEDSSISAVDPRLGVEVLKQLGYLCAELQIGSEVGATLERATALMGERVLMSIPRSDDEKVGEVVKRPTKKIKPSTDQAVVHAMQTRSQKAESSQCG